MVQQRRSFSDNDKAAALAALDANGGNVYRTAKELNVPRSTLQEWANGRVSHDVPELRQQKRQDLHELFLNEIYAIAELMPTKRHEATYSQLATAAGIFTDKVQLLTGKATQRTEASAKVEHAIQEDTVEQLSAVLQILNDVGAFDPPSDTSGADTENE